jgi:hypothetical protein
MLGVGIGGRLLGDAPPWGEVVPLVSSFFEAITVRLARSLVFFIIIIIIIELLIYLML